MGRVLNDAPLSCFMHNHRARERHRLTGQHRSHMVPDAVHDTAMARFGGSVIPKTLPVVTLASAPYTTSSLLYPRLIT